MCFLGVQLLIELLCRYQVDFMALEMRHGKVAFLWDSGSGHTKLEYPNLQINNNKWHRINATRYVWHSLLATV